MAQTDFNKEILEDEIREHLKEIKEHQRRMMAETLSVIDQNNAESSIKNHIRWIEEKEKRIAKIEKSSPRGKTLKEPAEKEPTERPADKPEKEKWRRTKKFGRGIKKGHQAIKDFNPDASTFKYEILLWFALIVHFIDFRFLGFNIDAGGIQARAAMYAVLGIITYIIAKNDTGVTPVQIIIGVAIPVIFIPLAVYALGLFNVDAVTTADIAKFLLMLPSYVFFLIYYVNIPSEWWRNQSGIFNLFRASFWLRMYFIYLLYIFIFDFIAFLPQAVAVAGIETDRMDFDQASDDAIHFLTSAPGKIWGTFSNAFSYGQSEYERLMNQSLGEHYTGQVEQNRVRTGVFIENFKSTGKYYSGEQMMFFPIVAARSFSGDIKMEFECIAYDTRNKSNNVTGEIDSGEIPSNMATIYSEDRKGIICRFNTPTTMLTPGRYSIEFTATFDFETWAYTNYIFMEQDFIASLRASGEDPNKKFGIPRKPETIYTSGPVKIGMRQNILDGMPFPLSYQRKRSIPIGMTVENADRTSGEIINVNEFQLRVPQQFVLRSTQCTRNILRTTRDNNNYMIYTFERDTRSNLKQTYVTIDCNMEISQTDSRQLLGGSGGIAQASMVGMANYTYQLKKKISILVNKNPI